MCVQRAEQDVFSSETAVERDALCVGQCRRTYEVRPTFILKFKFWHADFFLAWLSVVEGTTARQKKRVKTSFRFCTTRSGRRTAAEETSQCEAARVALGWNMAGALMAGVLRNTKFRPQEARTLLPNLIASTVDWNDSSL